jgi:hypothetical protein
LDFASNARFYQRHCLLLLSYNRKGLMMSSIVPVRFLPAVLLLQKDFKKLCTVAHTFNFTEMVSRFL